MADEAIPPSAAHRHPLAGRRQSAEHVAKRVAAVALIKANWTPEKYATWYVTNAAANRANGQKPEVRARNAQKKIGSTPRNKGNRWQAKLTPEEVRAITARRARERRARSPKRRLHERISARVRQSLRGDKYRRSWEALVGYTLAELHWHLDRTMPAGFTWDDFAAGDLHVDHIIPVAAFNFTKAEDIDFKRCWALSNLRLLPAQENLAKKATLSAPFQPSLAIG